MRRRRRKMWRRTFGRQKVLPRTPFQKTFFRWGRWSPPLDGGERTTARGPGKQKKEGIVAFLFLFLVCMACLAYVAYLYGCPVQNKNAEGRVPSAFYVMSAVLFVRKPCLSWPFFAGGPAMGLSGVVPGRLSSCIKRVGRRIGGRRDLCAQAGDRRRPRPCPLRRRELRASTAGQGLSFPQKNLLTCGRSAGEARRGSCGLRPACGRRG